MLCTVPKIGEENGFREAFTKRDYENKLVGSGVVSEAAEAYSDLFSALTFNCDEGLVIAISSAKPAEGKSLLCANLAKTAALCGKRVIALECDMHCPALAKILKVAPCGNIADILSGAVEYERGLVTEISENFDALLCGEIPSEQNILLASYTFRALVKHLKESYDLVIIDTPPVTEHEDLKAVFEAADGVILTERVGYSSDNEVTFACEILEGKIIGRVINGG